MRIALGTALASSGSVGASLAQDIDDFILLDTITITASGEPVAVSHTGATVTVLTEDDITRAGTLSFGNLMAQQPGVSFDANGGPGTTSAVRIRGLSDRYVGARLDGFDVTDTAGPRYTFNFNTLGTSGLSRVEVLRGSQSALYGSEAIAGVIDVTTFRPTGDGLSGQTGIEAGTAATYTGELGVGFLDDRVELAFSASRTVSDGGFSAWADGDEDDGYDITTVAAYAAVQVSDSLRAGANVLWRRNYAEYDIPPGFGDPLVEPNTYSSTYQRGARAFAELEIGSAHHELSFSRLKNERIEVADGAVDDFDGTRDSLTYYGNWRANDALSLNWGYEDTRESYDNGGSTETVRTRAVFGEALYSPNDAFDLSFALRHDEHEMFGGKATGRFAAAWRPADDWTLRAVASTGFRAPSLFELYGGNGDSGLQPETSRSFELGVEHAFASGATLQLTAFDIRIQNLIDFDATSTVCGDPWGCYNQVDGETTSRGIELSGRTEISANWSLFGNYTYTDAHDDAGERAAKVPRHALTLGVEGELTDRLSTALTLRHSADTVALPDYTLINTNFSYALNEATEATFRVENLFDQDYQTTAGYNQPGRQVFVGVRTSF